MQLEPLSSTLDYLPQATVELERSEMEQAAKLVEALNDHDDVIRVYDNIFIAND